MRPPLSLSGSLWLAFLIIAVVVGGRAVPVAADQGALQAFASPISGATVESSGSWVFDEAASSIGGEADLLKFDSGFANILLGLMPAETSLLAADTAVVGPFAGSFGKVVDIESADAHGFRYSLNLAVIHGVEYGAFSLYTPLGQTGSAEAYVYLAPVSRFAEGLHEAREGLAINGVPLFGAFDGAALQAMLQERAGATGGASGERVNDDFPPLGLGSEASMGAVNGPASVTR